MGRKKKNTRGGRPFGEGRDPRRNLLGQPSNHNPPGERLREPRSIFNAVTNQLSSFPPGATLRPHDEPTPIESDASTSQNWLVDDQKLLDATNDAMQSHNVSPDRRGHVPKLQKHQQRKIGLAVQVSYRCGFKNCRFVSKTYDLFIRTSTGQPLQNMQVGVALSKTDLTAKSVETLSTTLNLDPPSLTTLHHSHDKALECTGKLAELAMRDNRREVTSTLRLRGEIEAGQVPSVEVALDGQFSNRSYHCPTGKSDSVSIPVVETVTGKGLLIQHVNLSHRDGSLPTQTHISSGEPLGAKENYKRAHSAEEYPLHFGVVTTDGDTGLVKSLEAGRAEVGESRPLKRRGCFFHAQSATKRKFTREGLIKLTANQKSQLEQSQPNQRQQLLPTNLSPNTCPACLKSFKSIKGLNIHKRSCKGERAEECNIKGLEPLFLVWGKDPSRKKLVVKDKKAWRDGMQRWVMQRIKAEMNLGLHYQNPQNAKVEDDSGIHEALFLGGKTIIPCLMGNHDSCLIDARACGGPESPPVYDILPSKGPIPDIPPPTVAWLNTIVDTILSREALRSLVVHGKKATTSLVESAHKEIRGPAPKGRVYRKNEGRLVKSGA